MAALRLSTLDSAVGMLDQQLAALAAPQEIARAIARWRMDAAALRFHLRDPSRPPVVAILGGTGTGKSTVLNRLLDANLSATSFRRTYTAGAVAVTANIVSLPADWLGVPHRTIDASQMPARGQPDTLIVIRL